MKDAPFDVLKFFISINFKLFNNFYIFNLNFISYEIFKNCKKSFLWNITKL